MSDLRYWGYGGQYGPYAAQDDGWPDAGEVMRDFREQAGLSAGEFALLYSEGLKKLGKQNKKGKQSQQGQISEIWVLNMEKQNKVPADIERRRLIAEILHIPPILLGLASLETVVLQAQQPAQMLSANGSASTLQHVLVDIATYRKRIRSAMHLQQTSSAQNLLEDVNADLRDLGNLEVQARGGLLYQVRGLLVGNNLLGLKIVKDQRQYALAITYANDAIRAARSMRESEMVAAAKYLRGCIKCEWGQYGTMQQGRFVVDRSKIQDAISDFQEILSKLTVRPNSVHPQLVGLTRLQLSRAQAILNGGNQHDQATITDILTAIDQAADMIGRHTIDDLYTRTLVLGSMAGLHQGAYHHVNAEIFNAMGQPAKVLTELDQVKRLTARTYGQDETRTQARMDIITAEALMGLKEYGEAAIRARNSLMACHTIGSIQNVAVVVDLHSRLVASPCGSSADVRELGDMLQEWYALN